MEIINSTRPYANVFIVNLNINMLMAAILTRFWLLTISVMVEDMCAMLYLSISSHYDYRYLWDKVMVSSVWGEACDDMAADVTQCKTASSGRTSPTIRNERALTITTHSEWRNWITRALIGLGDIRNGDRILYETSSSRIIPP